MRPPLLSSWRPAHWATALTGLLALGIAYDLWRMPIQAFDALLLLDKAQASPSAWSTFVTETVANSSYGYLRPALWTQVKLLFDLSQGHYFLAFRGFHVFLTLAFLALFVAALRVRDARDLAALPLALAVFVGTHTFIGTVKEAYPISHYLEASVLCLLVLNLAQSRGGWPIDVAAGAAFVLACLTIESGLLVWVVAAGCWIVGFRGISTRGVAAMTALLIGYVVLRALLLETGVPGLGERSAGFMINVLDPTELQRRFGSNPLPFYAHNVAASISTILFSQPRAGVWVIVREWMDGGVALRTWVNLAASLFATGLIGWHLLARWRSGIRWPATWGDRQLAVSGAVIAANAMLSFPYTKDEVLTTAGAFYAIAAFVATRALVEQTGAGQTPVAAAAASLRAPAWAAVTLMLVCAIGSAAWAVRAAGIHFILASQGYYQRTDWAFLPFEWEQNGLKPPTAAGLELAHTLREQAIAMPARNPREGSYWPERFFDANY